MFQEYDFKVIVKLGLLNVQPDHLSKIETGEKPNNLKEGLPDAQLFSIKVTNENFMDIIKFLSMGITPQEYTMQQKKELVIRVKKFTLIAGHRGADEIF